jgi:hypothetical protein
MFDFYDSHLQFEDNELGHKTTGSSLKLVVSNPPPHQTTQSYKEISKAGFSSEVQKRGSYLYSLLVRDSSHYLECELFLEAQKRKDANDLEPLAVICHFPNISDEKLNDYVWEDEILLGMILIQFQMKTMEQLLVFCSNQHASNLIIYTDDTEAESLEIYREFLLTEGRSLSQVTDNFEIIIPINEQIVQKWDQYMKKVNIQFRQTLWREQRLNPAIHQYLKIHPLG